MCEAADYSSGDFAGMTTLNTDQYGARTSVTSFSLPTATQEVRKVAHF